MRFLIEIFVIFACSLGVFWLFSWLKDEMPPGDVAFFNFLCAVSFICVVGCYLDVKILDLKHKMDDLERKMDDLKNEIDGGYYGEGGLKSRMGYLESEMDEIRRDLKRNEESGRTKEKSEEED